MNKIVASVSLVALSAASVQAQSTPPGQNITVTPAPKWWNVAATVRGFYDDNADTTPTGDSGTVRTWGFEVNPSIGVSVGNQQTTFSAGYAFHYLYYLQPITAVDSHGNTTSITHDDMDHTFTAALDHAFNENYSVHVANSFVVGQQPDTLRAGSPINTFQRVPGNNFINVGSIAVDGQLTRELGFEVGYANSFFNYDANEFAYLDRIENDAHIDLKWILSHETVGVLGYQFGYVDYNGTGPGALLTDPTPTDSTHQTPSSINNAMSHTVYAGADHTFLPNLTGSVRAGASYYDYVNDTGASDFGPYAVVSLSYIYAPESSLSVGFQEGRIASSVVSTNSLIHDTETSVVYGTVVHRITPNLFGTVQGTFQNSAYHGGGGGIDGKSDRYYTVGVQLEYRFNPNISALAGYTYDRLDSSLTGIGNRDYDRNKFYIGATARY